MGFDYSMIQGYLLDTLGNPSAILMSSIRRPYGEAAIEICQNMLENSLKYNEINYCESKRRMIIFH
jgi:hypothetical protein